MPAKTKKQKNKIAPLNLPENVSDLKSGTLTVYVVVEDGIVLWDVQIENKHFPQSQFKFVGPYWAMTKQDFQVHGNLDIILLIQGTESGLRGSCRPFWNSQQLTPDVAAVTHGGSGSGSRSYPI